MLRCLHAGAWCVQGSTLGTSLVCCWISSSRIKVPKQICLDMWMDLVLSRHKCFLVWLADDLLDRQAMLHRLDMARKGCTTNVFEPIYVVQGLQWSGDSGSGMAVRRRSGWARAQVGFAGFGMGLFGWIMSVVVLGSAVLWFHIWNPGELLQALSVYALWNWTLVIWLFGYLEHLQ